MKADDGNKVLPFVLHHQDISASRRSRPVDADECEGRPSGDGVIAGEA
jgi:hypothetical protein